MERQTATKDNQESINLSSLSRGTLQRKCACGNQAAGGGECGECGKKKQFWQRRAVHISEPGDRYEQEADRIADEVMRMPEPTAKHQVGAEKEGVVQRKAIANQDSSLNLNQEFSEVPPIVHAVLRSPGQPLAPETRNFMERRFGHDFSQVRVHTDAKAINSAQAINALAYTIDKNIVFNNGQYQSKTMQGRRLIAHELAHILQQQQPSFKKSTIQRQSNGVKEDEFHRPLVERFRRENGLPPDPQGILDGSIKYSDAYAKWLQNNSSSGSSNVNLPNPNNSSSGSSNVNLPDPSKALNAQTQEVIFAMNLYAEAGIDFLSYGIDSLKAIAQVVLNRVSLGFAKNYKNAILAKSQFSWTSDTSMVNKALKPDRALWDKCSQVTLEALGGKMKAPQAAKNATYFLNPDKAARQAWTDDCCFSGKIGRHCFYEIGIGQNCKARSDKTCTDKKDAGKCSKQ